VTGFRIALGGAQERFGVLPDLATYAKAISNGYAMGAVVGRREVMQVAADLFISSTYWSDAVGLSAALATLRELRGRDALARVGELGEGFRERLRASAAAHGLLMRAEGLPQQLAIVLDEGYGAARRPIKDLYVQEMTRRGFFTSFGVSLCAAHTEGDLDALEEAWGEVFPLLAQAIAAGDVGDRLEAPPSVDAFRRQVG
jgi:glutamate-1-semialdehyde aminotransferase